MCAQTKRILFLRSGTSNVYEEASAQLGYQTYTINPIQKKFINLEKLADKLSCGGFDGLIFSSQTSVEAFRSIPDIDFKLPVYAVGKATAQSARNLGFKCIIGEDSGSSTNLANVILTRCTSPNRLLFPGADKLIGGLKEPLENAGHYLEILPVYKTTSRVTIDLQNELEDISHVDVAVYFSPSGVESIHGLISDRWPNIRSIAIGQSTAKLLADCIISPSPDVEGVIHCLAQIGI